MAQIPLAQMWQRTKKPRKREVTFRPINPPGVMASDLYASGYAPVVAHWQSAIPAIMAQYERTLSSLATDSAEDMGSIIGSAEREAESVMVRLRIAIGAWAAKAEVWQRRKWVSVVMTATGVDIGAMLGPTDARMTVGASIERNVGLVKSVSDQARQRISQAVFDGLKKRKPAAEVARELREAVGMSQRRARNIASDQLTKISSELASERRRQVGIDTWEWVHSGKAHPREDHKARNGKRYTDETAPDDIPGELPFCGCVERAVLSLDGEF